MQYEIYIDSLFFLNLGLNLYLLELVNSILYQTVSGRKIILGAVLGSLLAMLPLLLPWNLWIGMSVGFICSMAAMIRFTFKCQGVRSYIRLVEISLVMSIFLGAVIQYLFLRFSRNIQVPVLKLWVFGAMGFLVFRRLQAKRNQMRSHCKVILKNQGTLIKVDGLVDTGNTLVEPISGKPAAVLDKKVFDNLFWDQDPAGFRIIPYRSIDKKNGIMPGYLIPNMQVEWGGICVKYQNVYVAVRPDEMEMAEKYPMIINPNMLKKEKMG